MKQAIIIPTCKPYSIWLQQLLDSIDTKYPIILCYNNKQDNKFEARALLVAKELGIEEFFVLQDTCIIKDNSLFTYMFEELKGKSCFMNPLGQMFMNKYLLSEIDKIGWSEITDCDTKLKAVMLENNLNTYYRNKFAPVILDPLFIDNDKREFHFGRDNMILENKWIKKYKGSFDGHTMRESDKYVPRL